MTRLYLDKGKLIRVYFENGTFDIPIWMWRRLPKELKKRTKNPGHVYEEDYKCPSGR